MAGTGTSPSTRSRSSTSGSSRRTSRRSLDVLRVGLADARAADRRRSSAPSPSTSASATPSRSRRAPRRCTSPTWPPASGPGDEVIVPSLTFAATAAAVLYCGGDAGVRRHRRARTTSGSTPTDVERADRPRARRPSASCTSPATRPRSTRCARSATRTALALIEDAAHAPERRRSTGGKLGTWGLRRRVLASSPTRSWPCGEGGLLATDDDEVAALARSLRSHGMTSGTWSRHTRETDSYDVVGLGFNYRLDEPRAALLLSRLAPARRRHRAPPRAHARLPRASSPASRRRRRALRRRGRRALVVLRDADRGRRRRPARRGPAAACATRHGDPDLAASIPPCTSSRPTASASASCAAADRARRPRRDHAPAVPRHRRGDAGPRGRARCARRSA